MCNIMCGWCELLLPVYTHTSVHDVRVYVCFRTYTRKKHTYMCNRVNRTRSERQQVFFTWFSWIFTRLQMSLCVSVCACVCCVHVLAFSRIKLRDRVHTKPHLRAQPHARPPRGVAVAAWRFDGSYDVLARTCDHNHHHHHTINRYFVDK